jgi:hypothetical protein
MKEKVKVPRHVSATALGSHLDLSRQRVRQLTTEGVIKAETDGKYDPDNARIAYIRWLRAPERRTARSEAAAQYHTMKSRYLALKIAEAEGKLADVEEVNDFIDQFGALVVTEIEAVPARVAGRDLPLRRKLEQAAFDLRTKIADKAMEISRELKNGSSK